MPMSAEGPATAGASAGPKVATMVSAGADMSCAAMADGSVWCWGSNERGQLGNGSKTTSWVPVRVKAISSAVAVSAGGTWNSGGKGAALSAFACAVLRNGAVVCWGDQFDNAEHSTPHTISGVRSAVAIACGNGHACALTSSGSVLCWGANDSGQLGLGDSPTCRESICPASAPVGGIAGATAIAGQGSNFSCAVLADGSVWCWGAYQGGTDFRASMNATSPVRVSGVSASARGLAAGRSDTCIVSRDGELQCWGLDYPNAEPVSVPGLRAAPMAVSAGEGTACALLGDHTVQCWGEGRRGQLGNDSYVSSQVPVDVKELSDAVAISVGYLHACAVTKAGNVRCWGANDGGLGYGAPTAGDVSRPVTVMGL